MNGRKQACTFNKDTTGSEMREEVSKRLGTQEFHLTAKGKTISPNSSIESHGLKTGDVINVNARIRGGAQGS